MNLLELFVKIGVDDQATQKIGEIAGSVKSKLATAAKAGAAAMAATTVAVGGTAKAFVGSAKDVAAYGDNVDKMSQKMGLSASAYQEWDAVMQHSGTSMETMKASMKTLANAAETGNDAFQKLGLSQEQVASMSQEELFEATIAGLQNVSDTTERTYLAGKLLGRGATELGALLNTSAEDTQAMRDRVHELGGVMSDDAVKAAARFQDSMQDMQTAMSGLKRNMMAEFLPGMATVMDGLGNLFSGDSDTGLAQVKSGIDEIVAKAAEIAPKAIEVVSAIATSIASAIAENAPKIIPALADAMVSTINAAAELLPTLLQELVPAIISVIPTLLEASIQLFLAMVDAIAEAMPEIIDATVDLIVALIDKLPEYLPKMIEAAGTLVLAIGSAIIEKTPEILEKLGGALLRMVGSVGEKFPDMLAAAAGLFEAPLVAIQEKYNEFEESVRNFIQNGIDQIGGFFENMREAGGNLVQGLIDGIVNAPGDVAHALWDTVGGGVDQLKALLGIASPSKLMEELGGYTIEGFTNGVNALAGMAQGAIGGVARTVLGAMSSEIDGSRGDYVGLMGANMDAMVQRVGDAYSYIMSMGSYVVEGLLQGLSANMDAVTNILFGGVNGAIEYVKGFLGIASPSKLMAKLGGYTMEGLAKGIGDGAGDAERAMRDAVGSVYGAASGAMELAAGVAPASGAIGGAAGVTAPQINIIVNDPVIKEEADVDRILEYAKVKIAREMGVASWNPSASMA